MSPPDRQDVVTLTFGCADESCFELGGCEWQRAGASSPACPRCGGEMNVMGEFVPLSRAERAEAEVERLRSLDRLALRAAASKLYLGGASFGGISCGLHEGEAVARIAVEGYLAALSPDREDGDG